MELVFAVMFVALIVYSDARRACPVADLHVAALRCFKP
jgi:hypothetical protein